MERGAIAQISGYEDEEGGHLTTFVQPIAKKHTNKIIKQKLKCICVLASYQPTKKSAWLILMNL